MPGRFIGGLRRLFHFNITVEFDNVPAGDTLAKGLLFVFVGFTLAKVLILKLIIFTYLSLSAVTGGHKQGKSQQQDEEEPHGQLQSLAGVGPSSII